MRLNRFVPVGALVLALGAGAYSAEAGQRDSRGRDRNGRASQGQTRRDSGSQERRDSGPREESVAPAPSQRAQEQRQQPPAPAPGPSTDRRYAVPRNSVPPPVQNGGPRSGGYDQRSYGQRGNDQRAYNQRGYESRPGYGGRDAYRNNGYRNQPYRYDGYRGYGYAPRAVVPGYYPRHYYGPGGSFSVYFGWGNGYLYGAPWTGRVYGYTAPRAVYGSPVYYGDVRLLVQPRDAAVYVDGYYAGIVDDFDGVFQRLTLTAGPHQLELAAPGLEARYFDVYVDPTRTIDIHADLFR